MKTEKGANTTSFKINQRSVRRVTYHGSELTRLREKTGLKQKVFAALCGWGQSHQSVLELPFEHTIDIDKLNTINRVAEEVMARQV